jgi:hypothetical protein
MRLYAVTPVFLAILVCTAVGQDFERDDEICNFCFRGKQLPKCCSFFIFESGMVFSLARSGYPSDKEGFIFTADLGVMFNKKNSKAWGGSFHLAADDDGSRIGIGPRYRIWTGPGKALDLSPKLMFGGSANRGVARKFPGFVFQASYSVGDYFSIDSYFQAIPYKQAVYNYSTPLPPGTAFVSFVEKTETGLYLGVSGRSYLAPVVPVALAIIIAATFDLNWGY